MTWDSQCKALLILSPSHTWLITYTEPECCCHQFFYLYVIQLKYNERYLIPSLLLRRLTSLLYSFTLRLLLHELVPSFSHMTLWSWCCKLTFIIFKDNHQSRPPVPCAFRTFSSVLICLSCHLSSNVLFSSYIVIVTALLTLLLWYIIKVQTRTNAFRVFLTLMQDGFDGLISSWNMWSCCAPIVYRAIRWCSFALPSDHCAAWTCTLLKIASSLWESKNLFNEFYSRNKGHSHIILYNSIHVSFRINKVNITTITMWRLSTCWLRILHTQVYQNLNVCFHHEDDRILNIFNNF